MRARTAWLAGTMVAVTVGLGLSACVQPVPPDEPGGVNVEVEDGGGDLEPTSPDAQTEKPIGVSINLSDESILMFDGDKASAQLVDDMLNGKTPKSCTVCYDQMGALPTVTITDARTMREVYKKLARMRVRGTTDMSLTDSYHLVSFELQDGTVASYNFEGADILTRGSQNYEVADLGDLWAYVQDLQESYLRDQQADDDWLAIKLEDEDEMVRWCPKSAPPGEVVQMKIYSALDAELHISVNGEEGFGEFASAEEYEFVMPNEPVTIRVWLVSYDLA